MTVQRNRYTLIKLTALTHHFFAVLGNGDPNETLEIILIIVKIATYVAVIAVLVYMALILKEVQGIVKEVKEISKTAGKLIRSIAEPINSMAGFIGDITKGVDTLRSLVNIFDKKGKEDEYDYEEY